MITNLRLSITFLKVIICISLFYSLVSLSNSSGDAFTKNHFFKIIESKSVFKTSFFIDKEVQEHQKLLAQLKEDNNSTIFQLFTHGKPGALLVKGQWLNKNQLVSFLKGKLPDKIKHLNIYGCEFAKGDEGRNAVAFLEKELGVSVSASTNVTGKGGDWNLEVGKSYNAVKPFDYNSNLQCADSSPDGDCDGDTIPNKDDLDDDNDGMLDTEETNCLQSSVINGAFNTNTLTNWYDGSYSAITNNWEIISASLYFGYAKSSSNLTTHNGTGLFAQYGDNTSTSSLGLVQSKDNDKAAHVYDLGVLNAGSYKWALDFRSKAGLPSSNGIFNPMIWNATTKTEIDAPWNQNLVNYPVNAAAGTLESSFVADGTSQYYLILPSMGKGGLSLDYSVDRIVVVGGDCDFDGDGIPNYLDLDSDNDGCFDALEGSNTSLTLLDVTSEGRLNSGVDTNTGIPTAVGSGQDDVSATDSSVTSGECDDDGDGVLNKNDKCKGGDDSVDSDGDGVPDSCDLDDDNDGILDTVEENCLPVVSGYDAYWPLDGNTNDVSGNNHNKQAGTVGFNNVLNRRKGSDAASFNGSSDYLQYNDGTFLNQEKTAFTYSFWIKPNNLSSIQTLLDEGGVTHGLAIRLNNNFVELGVARSSVRQIISNGFISTGDDSWHHIAATYNNGKVILYFDGVASVELDTGTGALATHNNPHAFGGTNGNDAFNQAGAIGGAGQLYEGLMDEIIHYPTALTPIQIAMLSKYGCDYDEDGISNVKDTDSDNDGCPDAIEGGDNVKDSDLVAASGNLQGGNTNATVGSHNKPVLLNLPITNVDSQGVPNIVNVGQTADVDNKVGQVIGSSLNAGVSPCCDATLYNLKDVDGDNVADSCDLDNDNDGVLDTNECLETLEIIPSSSTQGEATTAKDKIIKTTLSASKSGAIKPNGATVFSIEEASGATYKGTTYTFTFDQGLSYLELDFNNINYINDAVKTVLGNFVVTLANGAVLNNVDFSFEEEQRAEKINFSGYRAIAGNVIGGSNQGKGIVRFKGLPDLHTNAVTSVSFQLLENNTSSSSLTVSILLRIKDACDTDGDGTPDYLDTDSDNDGCFDALEAAGSYNYTQLDTNGRFTGGVDSSGVPNAVGASGQSTTEAVTNSSDATACCSTSISGLPDKDNDGITDGCDVDDDNDGILDDNECNVLVNGGLEGPIPSTGSNDLPSGWEQVAFSESYNEASEASLSTSDLFSDNQPAANIGLAGKPAEGDTAIHGVYGESITKEFSQEGLKQTLQNLVVGNTYTVVFKQAVLKTQNYTDNTGQWKFFIDGNLVHTSSPTTSLLNHLDKNIHWDTRTFTFTATSASHEFAFLAFGATTNVKVAMAIDDIHIYCDYDRDGVLNHLDTDSDDDGCSDAIEGAGDIISGLSVLTGGSPTAGSSSENLGTDSDTQGRPLNGSTGYEQNTTAAVVDSSDKTACTIDLRLTKVVNNAAPRVGQNITYTITVVNDGPLQATGVSVTDVLPVGVTYVSDTSSKGTYDNSTGIWDIGSMNVGASEMLQITAAVSQTGVIINKAEVRTADQPDIDSTPSNKK